MSEQENAVGVREVAEILDVAVDTVYRKAKRGEIPGFRIGRAWRFFPTQIRNHLNKQPDDWAYLPRSRQGKRAA